MLNALQGPKMTPKDSGRGHGSEKTLLHLKKKDPKMVKDDFQAKR